MLKQEIFGSIGGMKFYRVEIPVTVYQRLVTFTREGVPTPDWIDGGPSSMLQHRVVAVSDTEWFKPFMEEQDG